MTARNTLEKARRARELKGIKTDMERILALPQTPDSPNAHTKWTRKLRKHVGAPPLRPIQGLVLEVAKLLHFPKAPVAPVGVGHGKTLISFLLPAVWGCTNPVLLIPPAMRQQCLRDMQEWSQHYDFPTPTIVAYSDLSSPTRGNILEVLKPDCIIADEAHCLRHLTAARTKRFIRYMQKNPDTRFSPMSGTLTSKSMKDYGHLCELALRGGSPLPLDERTLDIWSSVLDPDGEPDKRAFQALTPMVAWCGAALGSEGVYRKSFQERFRKTLGVVASKEGSVGCSLLLQDWRDAPQVPAVTKALQCLSSDWELPNGEYLSDALEFMRAARQISLGFYYVWDWPNGDVDHEWHDARKAWGSACGSFLRYHSEEGRDSESLLVKWIESGQGGSKLRNTYYGWKMVSHRPVPPTKAVWLDDTYLRHAVNWVKRQKEPTLIWFSSRAVGDRLRHLGVNVHHQTDPRPGETCALSIPIHHKGRNYQAWGNNFILELPPTGATWEQLLGRTHRQGQQADTVFATLCQDYWPQSRALDSAKKQAKYIEETTGNKQKLCYCDWA